jgi:hypothetical protein
MSATDNPNYETGNFTVSVDNNYGYIKYGSITVARVSHSVYSSGQANGWGQAYGKITWPGSNTSSATMTVKYPASGISANPQQLSKDYTVSVDSSYAYIKNGSTTVARVAHSYKYTTDQYNANYSSGVNAGYTACYNSIEMDPSSFSTLAYNTTYTVAVKAYTSSSATAKTNKASVSFKTPADRYSTGYSAGWSAAYGKVSFPSSENLSSSSIVFKFPGTSTDTQSDRTYSLAVDSSYAYLYLNTTKVARLAHSYKYTEAQRTSYGNTRYSEGKNDGHAACFASIEITSSNGSSTTLSYGQELTVYAKAYATGSANAKTNAATAKFTAPADRYWDGYDAGWLHYYDLWTSTYQVSNGKYTYLARTPIDRGNGSYQIVWSSQVGNYSGGGGGSSGTSGSGTTTYANSVTLYCSNITTNNNGVKTVTFTVNYSASQNVPFTKSKSYNFHY